MMVWDEGVAEFVGQFIAGGHRGFGECQALGFLAPDGTLQGGVVYHNWSPETGVIEVSVGSVTPAWLTRARMKAVFSYPFDQLACRMVIARNSEWNDRARRIWDSLGATAVVIPRLRSDTENEILHLLHVDQWRASRYAS